MNNDIKRFAEWIIVKSDLHTKAVMRNIKDGEVYWCAVGENIGVEINGKSETFAHPVVVLKKLSQYGTREWGLYLKMILKRLEVDFVICFIKKCPLTLRLGWTGIPEYIHILSQKL